DGDGDEAAFAEHEPVAEGGLADVADGEPVDVDPADLDLAGDGGAPVDEVDDDAVLGEHDPLLGHPGEDGECGVGPQVAPFAVHRHDVARAHRVVEVEQLACGRVAGDVHLRGAL